MFLCHYLLERQYVRKQYIYLLWMLVFLGLSKSPWRRAYKTSHSEYQRCRIVPAINASSTTFHRNHWKGSLFRDWESIGIFWLFGPLFIFQGPYFKYFGQKFWTRDVKPLITFRSYRRSCRRGKSWRLVQRSAVWLLNRGRNVLPV